jgi:hypothetical protein
LTAKPACFGGEFVDAFQRGEVRHAGQSAQGLCRRFDLRLVGHGDQVEAILGAAFGEFTSNAR